MLTLFELSGLFSQLFKRLKIGREEEKKINIMWCAETVCKAILHVDNSNIKPIPKKSAVHTLQFLSGWWFLWWWSFWRCASSGCFCSCYGVGNGRSDLKIWQFWFINHLDIRSRMMESRQWFQGVQKWNKYNHLFQRTLPADPVPSLPFFQGLCCDNIFQ